MAIADLIEASANQIDRLERAILGEAKRDENMRRLTAIPGLGAIMAATIKALVPDLGGFKSVRQFAAWLGLTPRSHSTGGNVRLGRSSKIGNAELRSLLVLGATAVLRLLGMTIGRNPGQRRLSPEVHSGRCGRTRQQDAAHCLGVSEQRAALTGAPSH